VSYCTCCTASVVNKLHIITLKPLENSTRSWQFVLCQDVYHCAMLQTNYQSVLKLNVLARLQTWRAIIFSRVCLSVCLCVCLWPALLPFNVNRFWRNLVTRTLLWSSLVATIMVQIGRRGTARRLFENFKKILKNHRIRISKFLCVIFLRLCLLCIVKQNLTRFEQNWRRR